jgi:hypothetical protein
MPLLHCQHRVVQKHHCSKCRQNPLVELTLIYGSKDAYLDIGNRLHTVQWFSGASDADSL